MPDAFVVVVNDQGQRALWRPGLALPSGWRRASAVMARGAGTLRRRTDGMSEPEPNVADGNTAPSNSARPA
jgi:hypothetical protein